MPKKLTNGFATKKDLKKLERKMDMRFEQVDKRFEQVDKRFEQVDKRFEQVDKRFEQVDKRFEQVDKRFEQINGRFGWFRSEIKEDLKIWLKDVYRKFEHRWQQQIDPILKEITKHREEEIIMHHQYQRNETLLRQIAQKIGISTTE